MPEKMKFERIVRKSCDYYYLETFLEFDNGEAPDMTAAQFKAVILEAVRTLHGEVGKALVCVDILKYKDLKREAILRVPQSEFVKLCSSLTLYGKYEDLDCAFRISQVSSHLMGLSADSRRYEHKVTKT